MGFGLHSNSNIAQQFSEALNDLFRAEVDEVEDALLEHDSRPSAQRWLELRRALETRIGGHQRRLYFVHMYCDDNIIGVVGVHRAIRVLKTWRRLVQRAGIVMAIPEKRSLGVWAIWLGALIFASFGLIVVPKDKILRATAAISQLNAEGTTTALAATTTATTAAPTTTATTAAPTAAMALQRGNVDVGNAPRGAAAAFTARRR